MSDGVQSMLDLSGPVMRNAYANPQIGRRTVGSDVEGQYKERTCPECGNRFGCNTALHAYRIGHKGASYGRLFCSWHCLRAAQRREGGSKRDAIIALQLQGKGANTLSAALHKPTAAKEDRFDAMHARLMRAEEELDRIKTEKEKPEYSSLSRREKKNLCNRARKWKDVRRYALDRLAVIEQMAEDERKRQNAGKEETK